MVDFMIRNIDFLPTLSESAGRSFVKILLNDAEDDGLIAQYI